MRNVLTLEQAYKCGQQLREAAEINSKIIADKRTQMEAINNVPEKTDEDLRKMQMIEDDIMRYMEEETGFRVLADIILSKEVVCDFRTTISY